MRTHQLTLASLCLFFVVGCATGGGHVGSDAAVVDTGAMPDTSQPDVADDTGVDAGVDGDVDGAVDAGTDSGPMDTGVDTGPAVDSGRPCVSDEGCDDGLACNGTDRCDMATGVCTVEPHPGCDDGVACTADSCGDPSGTCTHAPMDSLCPDGQTCDPAMGCVTPPACSGDAECDNGNFCDGTETCDPAVGCRSGMAPDCDDGVACTADSCDPAMGAGGACVHIPADADRDGHAAMGCLGGDDCNDGAFAVHPGATETCDGTDEDCSGAPDDGPGMECVLGSGSASCTTMCGTPGSHGCNASCGYSTCVASAEVCGNSCDDDGNGLADDGCTVPPPANDTCAGAVVLSPTTNGTEMGTLIGATSQAAGCGGVDVFYKITVPNRSILYLDTFASSLDTAISYRGTSCPGSAVACNNDACGTTSSQLAMVIDGGTHYFSVHTASSSIIPGTFSLRHALMPASQGLNVELRTTGSYSGTTGGAGLVSASCGSSATSPEDVYYWTQCPGQTRTVRADLCNPSTSWDTVLHLEHEGTSVACNDDDSTCFDNDFASSISTTASGAGLFELVVDGYGSSNSGSYRLDVTTF